MIITILFGIFVFNPTLEKNRKNAVIKKQVGTFQCKFNSYQRTGRKVQVRFIFDQITIKGNFHDVNESDSLAAIKELCQSNAKVTVYYRYYDTFWFLSTTKMFERLVKENGQVIHKGKRARIWGYWGYWGYRGSE